MEYCREDRDCTNPHCSCRKQESTQPEEAGLMPCPFCGGAPYYPTKWKKNKSMTACSNNKCPIFGLKINVKQWNTRTPSDKELRKELEVAKELLKKVSKMLDIGDLLLASNPWAQTSDIEEDVQDFLNQQTNTGK